MNKFAKYSILLGLALIFISVIFSIRNLDRLWDSFNNNSEYTRSEFIATEPISSIFVDTRNMRVDIRAYDGENIKVTYSQNDRSPITITENNGNLSLIRENTRPRVQFFTINFNFRSPEIIIYVPEDLVIEYNVATSNARITVNNIGMLESTFRTTNSSVSINNIITDYPLEVRSSNGRIYLNNVDGYRVSATTSNSRINAERVLTYEIRLASSNGYINARDIESETVDFTTSNSRINLDNLQARNIDLRTSNGRIEGTIVGDQEDFRRDMRTSNGRININGNNHGTVVNDHDTTREYSIRAHTSNGRIDLTFR